MLCVVRQQAPLLQAPLLQARGGKLWVQFFGEPRDWSQVNIKTGLKVRTGARVGAMGRGWA